jgi:hypothetical protein
MEERCDQQLRQSLRFVLTASRPRANKAGWVQGRWGVRPAAMQAGDLAIGILVDQAHYDRRFADAGFADYQQCRFARPTRATADFSEEPVSTAEIFVLFQNERGEIPRLRQRSPFALSPFGRSKGFDERGVNLV